MRKNVFYGKDKTIKEQDLFKKVSLLGDIFIYAKQLEGAAALFVLFVGQRAEDKLGILNDLLKPAKVESVFGMYKPVTMKIHNSDLEIMKCCYQILECESRILLKKLHSRLRQ